MRDLLLRLGFSKEESLPLKIWIGGQLADFSRSLSEGEEIRIAIPIGGGARALHKSFIFFRRLIIVPG